MTQILILYYSTSGHTEKMAQYIARGVESVNGAEAILRTVPPVSTSTQATDPPIPDAGAPYATLEDLERCDGLALGSPAYFGSMAAPLKHFWDSTSPLWLKGTLINKAASVFTTASTMHGGQEMALINMMVPLLHHGMAILGLPYSEPTLNSTTSGGTPYGASHYSGATNQLPLSQDEKALCQAQGKRLATIASKLKN